jgi:hypothetical protein
MIAAEKVFSKIMRLAKDGLKIFIIVNFNWEKVAVVIKFHA